VQWAPSGQFLAAGSFDNKVRVFNNVSWKVIGEYAHGSPQTSEKTIAYYERIDNANQSSYVLSQAPHHIPTERLEVTDPNPKLGVGFQAWSPDSHYLATKCDANPSALWIWETMRLSLYSLVVQDAPILSAVWDPTQSRLALCTGNNKVYFWSCNGCSCVDVPMEDFSVRKVSWSPQGDYLALQDKNAFCVCYMAGVDF